MAANLYEEYKPSQNGSLLLSKDSSMTLKMANHPGRELNNFKWSYFNINNSTNYIVCKDTKISW